MKIQGQNAFESGISLIEWPEKIGGLLPKRAINIYFEITDKGRQISVGEK